jgi:hypothetical protein
MTTPTPPPIPHRSWCQDPGNVFIYNDESGFVIARCRSCRGEYLDWPDAADNDASTA